MMDSNVEKSLLLSSGNYEGYTTIKRHVSCDVEIQRIEPKSANLHWAGATLIIANIVLGTGLLNYPHIFFLSGGILPCILIQLFALSLVQCSLLLIAKCADLSGKCSYQDIVQFYTGNCGAIIANLFIVIHAIGTCVAYLVLIADQLDQMMYQIDGSSFCHKWYMNRSFTLMIVASVVILPMCFPKDIDSYKFNSALGVFSTLYIVGLVLAKYYLQPEKDVYHDERKLFNIYDIFKVAPAIIFSFECHIEIVPIYSSFRKRNTREISKSIIGTSFIALFIYNMVGIYGYATFSGDTKSDLLLSYKYVDAAVVIAMGTVALKAVLTYPLVFYCARLVFTQAIENSSVCSISELRCRIATTTLIFVTTVILALGVPTIGSIISLLGGTASLFIFVFPGLCYFIAQVRDSSAHKRWKLAIGVLYMIIGTFIIGATFTQSLLSFQSGELSENEVKCI